MVLFFQSPALNNMFKQIANPKLFISPRLFGLQDFGAFLQAY
jgi:hypothetical protein